MKRYKINYLENDTGYIVIPELEEIESYSHGKAVAKFVNNNPNSVFKEIKSERISNSSVPGFHILSKLFFYFFNSTQIYANPNIDKSEYDEIHFHQIVNDEKESSSESIELFSISLFVVNTISSIVYVLVFAVPVKELALSCSLVFILSTLYCRYKTILLADIIAILLFCNLVYTTLSALNIVQSEYQSFIGAAILFYYSLKSFKNCRKFNLLKNSRCYPNKLSFIKHATASIFVATLISSIVIYIHKPSKGLHADSVTSTVSKTQNESGVFSTFEIDGTTIYVPPPDGFIESSKRFPDAFKLRDAIPSVKLILLYFTKQEYEKRESRLVFENQIVADIKLTKAAERIKFDELSFKEVADETKKYFQQSLKTLNKNIQDEVADVDAFKENNTKFGIQSAQVLIENKRRLVIAVEYNMNNNLRYVLLSMILVNDKIINVNITGRNNSQSELDELVRIESTWVPKILVVNNQN